MTASPKDSSEGKIHDGLLFAWSQNRAVFLTLAIFGAASLVIHLFGFYLFQVVYPASGRLEPEPSRITLLNESDAAVNALLRNVEDRLVYLRPASAGLDVRVSLSDYSAQFHPSFSERQVAFKSVPPIGAVRSRGSGEMADPLAPKTGLAPELSLPPVDTVARAVSEKRAETGPRWRISGDLEGRALRGAEAFADSLPELGAPPAIRLRIGVGTNGDLRSFLPIEGQNHPRIDKVVEAVRQNLRFEPKAGTETEWGWLDINR